jgi:hypothetical protein
VVPAIAGGLVQLGQITGDVAQVLGQLGDVAQVLGQLGDVAQVLGQLGDVGQLGQVERRAGALREVSCQPLPVGLGTATSARG